MKVLTARIELDPRTRTQISEDCGIQRSNLATALNGRSAILSAKNLEKLMRSIGFPGGNFDTGIVHRLVVETYVDPLQVLFRALFPDGAEYVQFSRASRSGNALQLLNEAQSPSYAIYHDEMRLLVTHFSPDVRESDDISADSMPGLKKAERPGMEDGTVRLLDQEFEKFLAGRLSVDEFDRIFRGERQLTWNDVVLVAEREGVSPAEIVGWLKGRQRHNGKTQSTVRKGSAPKRVAKRQS